jgi:plastocyanin
VGPGTAISLKRANGTLVTHLAPGGKTIVVRDRASNHNFHLTGPGVDRRTGISFVGRRRWSVQLSSGTYTYLCDRSVQLSSGTYTYLCDIHQSTMRRSFTVG